MRSSRPVSRRCSREKEMNCRMHFAMPRQALQFLAESSAMSGQVIDEYMFQRGGDFRQRVGEGTEHARGEIEEV